MLIPARQIDSILAFDNSADTEYSWPNGSALWTTWNRIDSLVQRLNIDPLMPRIPDTNTFVNLGSAFLLLLSGALLAQPLGR